MHLRYSSAPLVQRASEASEADSQSCSIEISDIYLASERSERVTYRGKNEKIGDVYLFICIYVWTYVCHFVL